MLAREGQRLNHYRIYREERLWCAGAEATSERWGPARR
jgi:hypothetical protein